MSSFFKRNLKVLKEENESLAKRVEAYEDKEEIIVDYKPEPEEVILRISDRENNITVEVESTRKKGYTLKVTDKEQSIYLHSKYDSEKEGAKLAAEFEAEATDQIVALGCGLGYHLKSFVSKRKFDRLLVIEPYFAIFYAALFCDNLSSIFSHNQVALLIEKDEDIFAALRRFYQVSLLKEVKFFEHPASVRLFEATYDTIYEKIRDGIQYKNINTRTNATAAKMWRNNIISNLPHIIEEPKADVFFAQFTDKPIICVAAGPSLDKNIDKLKLAKEKALIMCVGTAFKALLKADIKPDIVVTMDGQEIVYKQFSGIEIPDDIFLFSEKANYPQVNKDWPGPQVFFTMKRNLSGWIEEMKGNYTVIHTGGTVAHSMVDLAYRFGGDPIVLVGQDLAYPEKGTHASGTIYEDDQVEQDSLIEVKGVNQKTVPTDKSFKSMINYFNEYFGSRPDRNYIDATEGGARIDHTKIMPLKEAINKYCRQEFAAIQKLKEIYTEEKPTEPEENFRAEVEATIDELEEVLEILEEFLQKISEIETKVNSTIQVSDEQKSDLHNKLLEYEEELKQYSRFNYFIQRTLLAEKLKYQEVTGQTFTDNKQEMEEKIKQYLTYWGGCWKQLLTSVESLKDILPAISN